jgi:hypothetical protein
MTHPPGKYTMAFHRNREPDGDCHYYRLRGSGQRILLREGEIRDVEPTPLGAVVTLHSGLEFKVTCPRPEQIIEGGYK